MNKPIRIGNLYGENRGTGFAGNIWETEGISPALTTMGGGNREPIIMEISYYECSKSNQDRILEQLDNERSGA